MKSVLLIFFLLYIVSAYSAENSESTLAIKEQGSYSGIYTLKIRDNEVFVNGMKQKSHKVYCACKTGPRDFFKIQY